MVGSTTDRRIDEIEISEREQLVRESEIAGILPTSIVEEPGTYLIVRVGESETVAAPNASLEDYATEQTKPRQEMLGVVGGEDG